MKRPGRLGRGLSALIPDDILDNEDPANNPDAPSALQMVRIDHIRPNPAQPRMVFSAVALEELSSSIREHGILTPLLVRRVGPNAYVLIAGERRLRAAGLAGLEEVPTWIRDDVSTREQLELALVENLQREDLDAIETAIAYRRMIEEFDMTQAEVAQRVGKDRATVANAVRLLRLPEFILAAIRNNDISAGHAKAMLSIPDEKTLRRVLQEIIQKGLSVRATEQLVKELTAPDKRKTPRKKKAAAYPEVEASLTQQLGTRVRIESRRRGKQGKIVIEYASAEELQRLIDHLSPEA